MKLVSVVICTYNGAKHISAQLDSILNQTYTNLEIIIADDHSTDNTVSILKAFASKHSNIQVYDFQENVGYIKNFERGISLSKGELISLSDQDDWWEPNKIELLVNNIAKNDLIYSDSTFVDEKLNDLNTSFSKGKNMLSSNNPLHFVIDNCVSGHAAIFTRKLFESAIPFPELIPHDWWLTFLASTKNGVKYFDKPLVKYRNHDSNAILNNSQKKSKTQKSTFRKNKIKYFYEACPETLKSQKLVLKKLNTAYNSFSIANNFKRVAVFYKNQNAFLKILKKSPIKKGFIVINMFFKLK